MYVMRHVNVLGMETSCLSFDILVDDLGLQRQRLPASAYIIAA